MKVARRVLFLLACLSSLALSATEPVADRWAPARFLLGHWTGVTSGEPGEGTVLRQYELVLKEQFIRESNQSTYPPQEKNRRGEVHDHVGYFSYDKARNLIVLRQFHVEGFVNQYVLAPEPTATKVVFVSERFENLSNEWRAKETYEIRSKDEFVEIFELAPPGKPFEIYSKSHFRRR